MKREELEKFKGDGKFMEEVLERMNEIYKKEAFPWTVEEENAMYDKYLRNEWVKSIIKKMLQMGKDYAEIMELTDTDRKTIDKVAKELKETVNV